MRMIILGGGFGGLNAALWLAENLPDSSHEVLLIAERPYFLFRPSLVWVPFGQRTIDNISFPLDRTLQKAGVQFIQNRAAKILPKENSVVLENGSVLAYEFLIIATGGFPDYEKIEGLKGNTFSIYDTEDALRTKERVERLMPGESVIIGVAQGNPNPALAYEFLFELDAYLKQEKKSLPLTFFTYEQEFFDDAGRKVTERLIKHLQEKQIAHYCNVRLEKVEDQHVFLSNGLALPCSFSLILPPYKGADYIFSSPDLKHSDGLIPVNSYLQSVQWDNIYAVGDTTIMEGEPTIKNGRAAELQGQIAAENICSRLQGKSQQREYQGSVLGLMDLGTDGGMFIIRYPLSKWGSSFMEWAADGVIPHLMKVAFEKYYMWKLS